MRKLLVLCGLIAAVFAGIHCTKKSDAASTESWPAIKAAFGANINPAALDNYAAQPKPAYITRDNTGGNAITNAKATLGRVLFYDNNLSIDNTISCGSCHKQAAAFSDPDGVSKGVAGGTTGRHSMRLVNSRFAAETRFFWNERAATLEQQVTQPIQDHAEMGFSGQNGRPGLPALLQKLQGIAYYKELFRLAYGDESVTEPRLQESLAQFIRSIQSFDSKYDAGRAQAGADNPPFPNFTAQENAGKNLFLAPPQFNATGQRTAGGLGCGGCHRPPEFDIDPNSLNNGTIAHANGAAGSDFDNTRSPSLRDLLRTDGTSNGPFMHTGTVQDLAGVLAHYNRITLAPGNNRLDPRLRPNGVGQQLQITPQEEAAVIAFLRTLSGSAVYTDKKWASPFK
jgi:cytochrome c peroxidase